MEKTCPYYSVNTLKMTCFLLLPLSLILYTHLLCISTSFWFDQLLGAARTRKLVETFFSAIFQPFLFISKLFQWFHGWNHKNVWKWTKKTWFCLLLKAGRHAKVGRLPEEVPWMSFFGWILVEKWLKKIFLPAFGCAQHPKASRNTQYTLSLIMSFPSSLFLNCIPKAVLAGTSD